MTDMFNKLKAAIAINPAHEFTEDSERELKIDCDGEGVSYEIHHLDLLGWGWWWLGGVNLTFSCESGINTSALYKQGLEASYSTKQTHLFMLEMLLYLERDNTHSIIHLNEVWVYIEVLFLK